LSSIRIFLVAGILATLTLFNFVAALRGYQSSMEEADLLFDNQLLDFARLVGEIDVSGNHEELRLGNNLAFQVWQQGELVAHSYHAPEQAIADFSNGFDFSNFDGYRWRTFSRQENSPGRWVMVAERTDLRFVLAENVVLESIFPILLSIPLIGLLIWFIVSQGLKPLTVLSTELKNKQVSDLSPIDSANTRQELEQVIQSINSFMGRLDQTLEREKRFSADAAHELRTPISALKVQLHNLSHEIDMEGDSWAQLQNGVVRMQHLVEQLLTLYRMTPDKFADNCHDVDLYKVCENVIAQQYSLVENKSQHLELEGDHCLITGEEFALETLISNLLSNASKYTPEDGSIKVKVVRKGDRVELEVEDSGVGIDEDERERIFDRFYHSEKSQDENILPGCGLGLTIVSHVAELHQASVSVGQSSFGHGSAFRVNFPGLNP
jgi:two-component system, OmpR family, sensor histidine kinase QseC